MVTVDRHQWQVRQSVALPEQNGTWCTVTTSVGDVIKREVQRQIGSGDLMFSSSLVSSPLAGRVSSPRKHTGDCDRDDELGGYDVELVDLSEAERVRYVCPVCLLLLRDPLQTTCGHRFCQRCICRWCRETAECPTCKTKLSVHADLFPDNCAKREILNLMSRCPNMKHGCDSVLPLCQLQGHLNVCLAAKELCELCGEQIAKIEMDSHQSQTCAAAIVECNFRLFGCQYKCERRDVAEHLSQCIEQHLLQLAAYIASHPCCCSGQQRMSANGNSHYTNHHRDLRSNVSEPIKLPSHDHGETYDDTIAVSLPDRAESGLPPSYFTEQRLAEICRTFQEQRQPLQRSAAKQLGLGASYQLKPASDMSSSTYQSVGGPVKMNTGPQHDDITTSANQNVLHMQLAEQSIKLAQYESRVTRLESRITELESDSGCRNGVFIMKIESFTTRRLPEARSGQVPVVYSQAFYSHPQGYKFCLRVHPVGVSLPNQTPGGSGGGPHLSLFIHLMRGDYDDVLDWPFRGRITLSVLDLRGSSAGSASGRSTASGSKSQQQQTPKKKDISACVPDTDPTLEAFQRPTSNRSRRGFGYVEFVPLADLQLVNDPSTSPYLIDDTLFIRATVEPAKNAGK